jgi:formamidopyrimidine-DNA glycosylase
MPELPDLVYIKKYLKREVEGKSIVSATLREPVVVRVALDKPFVQAVSGKGIDAVTLHGPFLRFELEDSTDLIINLMLAGKLQHRHPHEKAEGHLCCSFELNDDSRLNLCDPEKMAKLYVVRHGDYATIPRYANQGLEILSPQFTLDAFRERARGNSRKQVRVFINDHTALSAIGNAYADEILFDAHIHPKTFVSRLSREELDRLYASIHSVMAWGIREVEKAGKPIHVKVRDHMKVRNRKGEQCPRCGTTIRREGVRGYDVFFCPQCQPASRTLFLVWGKVV